MLCYSFGHMMDSDRMKRASKEDIARSCLAMVTYNISSLARLNAEKLVSVFILLWLFYWQVILIPIFYWLSILVPRFLLAVDTHTEISIGGQYLFRDFYWLFILILKLLLAVNAHTEISIGR